VRVFIRVETLTVIFAYGNTLECNHWMLVSTYLKSTGQVTPHAQLDRLAALIDQSQIPRRFTLSILEVFLSACAAMVHNPNKVD